ncbi:hypothetical protein M0Q97_11580 [Candidatus Dojkabacteria bacterium]|jgi:hypothetical protein|nr:hypothetical protein [Candidatus Dojkabacteria bacterium]
MDGKLLQRPQNYIISEMRAFKAPYVDPLILNFKLLFDFDATHGLFADEININSALAFLKRIGENERYEMLKKFIEIFKDVNKNYDFLFTEIEGIDEIINAKPQDAFIDAKININVRETADMRIQAMLTLYRKIWFDDDRVVEVLPENLREFNMSVLLFSGGYYNMFLYDTFDYEGVKINNETIETKIFPTLRKLSDNFFDAKSKEFEFNNIIVNLGFCSINNEESSKNFFSTISNDAATEQTKNNISFHFKYANYSGSFNNIVGEFNIGNILSYASAENRVINDKDYFKKIIEGFKYQGIDLAQDSKRRVINYPKMILSPSTPLGNAIKKIQDPNTITKMIRNTADFLINGVEDFSINKMVSKFNNIITQNFSDNFVDLYKNTLKQNVINKPTLIVNEELNGNPAINQSEITLKSDKNFKGISFNVSNIYNRDSF